MDVLSDVLRAVRLTGAVFFDVKARPPFVGTSPAARLIAASVMPDAQHVISFHTMLSGGCWAEIIESPAEAVFVDTGDIVIFPMGDPNAMFSAPRQAAPPPDLSMYERPADGRLPVPFFLNDGEGGEVCRFVCGYLGCDARPFNPLLEALPRLFRAPVSATSRGWLTDLVRLAVHESEQSSAGSETMLARIAELMFVEVVRQYMATLPQGTRGWLSGLRDRQVGAALRLIHSRPSEDWTLAGLAREVGLSRSALAERFATYVEITPMQYLARWRLQLAARLLEESGISIAEAANRVGYESEAAFNRAFKKYAGVPPGAWRRKSTMQRHSGGREAPRAP
jgi:AraC-like DNA-binding protein